MPPGACSTQGPSLEVQADWDIESDVWGLTDSLGVSRCSGGGGGGGWVRFLILLGAPYPNHAIISLCCHLF